MPKCSAPVAWTRGVKRPLGFCRTKPLQARRGRAVGRRGMGRFFGTEETFILDPKGREGEEKTVFFSANPHTTAITALRVSAKRGAQCWPPSLNRARSGSCPTLPRSCMLEEALRCAGHE